MEAHLVIIGEFDERLQAPARQLEEIATRGSVWGDCDDAAVLIGALLASVGIPARLVAVGPPGGEYMHVFIEAFDGESWWRLDPIVPAGATLDGFARLTVDV